jgi:putative lipoic acid-binding regulatory protein
MPFSKLKILLEEQYSWPDYYTFKFILKIEIKEHVLSVLADHSIEVKNSDKGNYISITSRKLIKSTEEVVAVYEEVGKIKGVITL